MIDDAKHNEVVAIVTDTCRQVLQQILGETIKDHYSEQDWQSISTAFAIKAATVLRRSYELSCSLSQSDLYTAKGAVNVEAVIAAFQMAEARIESPAKKAQLSHLIQYLRHSYEGLRSVFK